MPLTQYLEAEISYIKVKGVQTEHKCIPCFRGVSLEASEMC